MYSVAERPVESPWLPPPQIRRPGLSRAARQQVIDHLTQNFGTYLSGGTIAAVTARVFDAKPVDAASAEEAGRRELADILSAF
jgi:hypothetical protein